MDSFGASVTRRDTLEESRRNNVQEEALKAKEIIDQVQSNEGANINHESSLSESFRLTPPPKLSKSSENEPPPPPVHEEEERKYSCKYCNKKFSNKQALGGHQNAHKFVRTIEKNIQERQMSNITGSLFNRSQQVFNRATMNMPYFPQQGTMHHEMMAYAHAPRPLPGISKDYPGWLRPVPRDVTQFVERPSSLRLGNRLPGINFSTPGGGKSSPLSQLVPGKNFREESSNVQMNGRETKQVEEENSGLDLSLKL